MEEIWLAIPGFPFHEASSLGRIRSWHAKGPNGHRRKQPRLLTGSVATGGYLRLCMRHNGSRTSQLVHRLVLTTFVGPCPEGMWGLHKDGNRLNNAISNLRWGTPKENADDRTRHGMTMFGAKNHKSRLSADQVRAIREEYQPGKTRQADFAARFGVAQTSISAVLRGKNWRMPAALGE